MLEQGIILGDDANFSRLYGAIHAIDGDAARGRLVQSGDDAEQLGFADAARTEESHHLSLHVIGANDVPDLGGDVFQDWAAVVFERDVVDLQERFSVGIGGHRSIYVRSKVKSA